MAKRYRLSPLAEADLEEIWLYTLRHWSIEQADSYHKSLVAAFEGLAANKKYGRDANVLPGYQKYLCGAHVIYFINCADQIDIIRVLHQKQDVERHL